MVADTEVAVFLGLLFAIVIFTSMHFVIPTIVAFLMGLLLANGLDAIPGPRDPKYFPESSGE